MVVVHGLDDFLQIHSPGRAPDWWQVSVLIFYVAFGAWLVRRYGPTRDTARAPAESAHSMRG